MARCFEKHKFIYAQKEFVGVGMGTKTFILDVSSLLLLEGGGSLLLVLGEGSGLVGHGGEGDALAGRRPDEAGVGGDGDHPQGVPGGENSQGPALDLSCNRDNVSLKGFMMQGIIF